MYFDGFLLPVPTAAKERYRSIAESSVGVFKRHGALEQVEGWGDDVPAGTHTSFPLAVKQRDDESAVFAWIAWPDKATRDAGMKAAMADAALAAAMKDMPVDGKRMVFGGFASLLDLPGGAAAGAGYYDGFVVAVPDANRDAYARHARIAAEVAADNGALRTVEAWGDDVPDGVETSFPLAVQKQADETVVFSFIAWPDKATRMAGWQKLMADPRLDAKTNPMPFDGKRLIYGGFEPIVAG